MFIREAEPVAVKQTSRDASPAKSSQLPGGFRSSDCSLLNPTLPEAGHNRAEYDRIERDFRGIGWRSMSAARNEALTGYNVADTRECRARAGMRGYGFWKRFRDPLAFKVTDKRNPSRGMPGFLSLAARVRGTPLTGDIKI
jgi:hypothetical protein